MRLPRLRAAVPMLAALALGVSGCSVTTEPVVVLDCSTLAATWPEATDLITLPSGLKYRDVVVGPGAEVTTGGRVITRYAACVDGGGVFSYIFSPDRFIFTVGAGTVIEGLDKGVVGMRLGGRRQLVIPRELGYGATGSPGGFLVPNETLIITVDAVGLL